MSGGTSTGVELGYVIESPPWCLDSKFFPSKVGGKPAWLELTNVPETVKCKKCNASCVFLCQVYAPLYNKDYSFHRTIFIFVCLNPECNVDNCNNNFVVLRSQLRRENNFYSPDPPMRNKSWQPHFDISKYCKLCAVCGIKAGIRCSECTVYYYCSEEHQSMHWKDGHSETCGVSENDNTEKRESFLLPEYEIIWEPERGIKKSKENLKKEMEYLQSLVKSGQAGSLQEDASVDVLEECMPKTFKKDKVFQAFRKRVDCNPEQVLRYCVGGDPLWVSCQHIPTPKDIPRCQNCGSERRFEFQVLPQLLYYLSLDDEARSADWGTLVVYTCTQSCNGDPSYKEEFIYKQDH